MPTALVTGVTGQDGSYLAEQLLARGYRVIGTSRRELSQARAELSAFDVPPGVELVRIDLEDPKAVGRFVADISADEIYHLAGQTSVGVSFSEPSSTYRSLALTSLNLLDSVRLLSPRARIVVAGSGEVFGDTHGALADERTPLSPKSPYAAAKAAVHHLVRTFRESYGMYACTAILYNHESPRRPERFVTRKVVRAALEIAMKRRTEVSMGALDVIRDWGWAPEYVAALVRMAALDAPDDFIIATGQSRSLEEFVSLTFSQVGLNFRDHVRRDPGFLRPAEIPAMHANPVKAREKLDFVPEAKLEQVIERLISAEAARLSLHAG